MESLGQVQHLVGEYLCRSFPDVFAVTFSSLNSIFSHFLDYLLLSLHNLFGFILPPVFEKMAALQKAYEKSCICDVGNIFI